MERSAVSALTLGLQDIIQHLRESLPMLPDDIANMLVQSSEYGLTIKDAKTLVALNDGDRLEYYLDIVEILGKEFSENSQSLEKVGKIANNW